MSGKTSVPEILLIKALGRSEDLQVPTVLLRFSVSTKKSGSV